MAQPVLSLSYTHTVKKIFSILNSVTLLTLVLFHLLNFIDTASVCNLMDNGRVTCIRTIMSGYRSGNGDFIIEGVTFHAESGEIVRTET